MERSGHAPPEARADLMRLLRCRGLEDYAACALIHLEADAATELIDAVFESLRLFKSLATPAPSGPRCARL